MQRFLGLFLPLDSHFLLLENGKLFFFDDVEEPRFASSNNSLSKSTVITNPNPMPIIYTLIAHQNTIIAEYSTNTGNFNSIVNHILTKIPQKDCKLTYVYDRHLFHYIQKSNLTYLCMADDSFGRRIPFAFLDDLITKFEATYSNHVATSAISFGLNEFAKTIAIQMEYFSTNAAADKFRNLNNEIDIVKDVMTQNIERVLERGERIDILVDKTDTLNQASFAFKKRSTALRRQMWMKNQKIMCLGICGAILTVHLLVSFFCGFPSWSQCF